MEKPTFDQKAIHNTSKTRLKAWFYPKNSGPDLSPYASVLSVLTHDFSTYLNTTILAEKASKDGEAGAYILWTLADDQLSLSYYEL